MENPKIRQKNHEKKVAQQNLIKSIQESSKNNMLPELKKKMEDTTNLIVDILKEKKDISNIQIMSLISKGSLRETALGGNIEYTSQEIRAGFDLYLDMCGTKGAKDAPKEPPPANVCSGSEGGFFD